MPTKNALVIGIDDYKARPLRGCVNDARRVAKLLEGDSLQFCVRTLIDHQATRSAIREQVQWLLTDADTSLLFFAGHGWRTPIATYLVTHDYQPHDEGIDLQWLASASNRLAKPNATVIYLLDCCHSGDATVRDVGGMEEPMDVADVPSPSGMGRVLLAACRGVESALEYDFNGTPHGAFTHHFCTALSGAAADPSGAVTVNATYDYVATQLRTDSRQTPVMRGDQEGAIVLATNVKKVGTWAPSSASQLTPAEAVTRAEELLSRTHQAIQQSASIDGWKQEGFANACRIFEPTLNWFRRRIELQCELLKNPDFKRHNETCQHFYSTLCSISEGTRLSNGLIGTKIGSGSFGTVWRIFEGAWKEEVCFKAFHPNDLDEREKVSRFRRGYEAMKQLDHPNIIKVLQLSELPYGFFMQFVEGANLRASSPGSSLEPDQIVDLLIAIAETLKHAHGRGVIHRDVKPENILVRYGEDGRLDAYLTDFDLAWFSTATQVTQVAGFGSHFYAAPEQMDAPQSNVSHLATVDAYSFGQLCFFAVCGRDPLAFNHDGNVRAFSEELGRKWHDSDASKQMLDLFDHCTRFKPRERIQDFREICDQLAAVRALLEHADENYDARQFLEQTRFNLGGDLKTAPVVPPYVTLRSRSGRTEIAVAMVKDAAQSCGLDVTLRPNDLIVEGHSSADARSVINQRIDTMLQIYARDHTTERRGARAGAFEITVRIDRLSKDMAGVLKAREIISRTIDILEQA